MEARPQPALQAQLYLYIFLVPETTQYAEKKSAKEVNCTMYM